MIPLKDKKRVLMCLQMIYDEKLKVGRGKKGGAGSKSKGGDQSSRKVSKSRLSSGLG